MLDRTGFCYLLVTCCSLLAMRLGDARTASADTPPATPSIVASVDPFIGTDAHGHTFPGATVPFGMVQLSPDTRTGTWDGCAGYHYSDTSLLGFSHNHLTGTGCADLGNILIVPAVGSLPEMVNGDVKAKEYRCTFSHDHESATPGCYRVALTDPAVTVELTATPRVGVHRYTFPASNDSHLIIDLAHGIGNRPIEADLQIVDDRTLTGRRMSDGWGGRKTLYFYAECSKPFASASLSADGKSVNDPSAHGTRVIGHLDFKTAAREQILLRVGLSTVSVDGAKANLRAEMSGWDFEATAAAAKGAWETALAGIHAETADDHLRRTFYTALYHTMLAPTILSDVGGQYRGIDGKVKRADGFEYYTELSLWDTFRSEQPLLIILQPRRVRDIIRTMLAHQAASPKHTLPVWTNGGMETWCMIGNHAIPVITEAYAKGIRDFDAGAALNAMLASVEQKRDFHEVYDRIGYVPWDKKDKSRQSVSRTLEYAYDDACITRFAKAIGQEEVARKYQILSGNWRNAFDDSSHFFRGKSESGEWATPFNPTDGDTHQFTEANAWQYLFAVPQDAPGLIQTLGGNEAFVKRLQTMFTMNVKIGNGVSDISGLVGMDAHGNEPCHHVPYLFDAAGRPDLSQQWVRTVAETQYNDTPAGLCGNDDCGQMSAWYVFTALGIYPVDPSSGIYWIGSPMLDRATIPLDPSAAAGKTLTVLAKNDPAKNRYIQSATLNGAPLPRAWITHAELAAGGDLVFEMGATPSANWGRSAMPAIQP